MVNKSAAMMQTSTLVLLVHFILVLPSARARPGGDSGEAVRATGGDGGAVSWHGSARPISLLFPLGLEPELDQAAFLQDTLSLAYGQHGPFQSPSDYDSVHFGLE
jgi:hypothetical protein